MFAETDSRSNAHSRRSSLVAVGALAVFVLLFFRAVAGGGVFFYSDFHQTYEPHLTIVSNALRHGALFWTSRLANGTPILAAPHYAVFYLPHLATAAIGGARALTILAVAHFFWAAWGCWIVARRWGWGAPARWAVAVVFPFSGLIVSASAPSEYLWTAAWLPWLLVSFEELARARPGARLRAGLGATACLAMILAAGEPFVIAGGFLGLALFVRPGGEPRSPRSLVATFAPIMIAGSAAVLAVSPQILATLRLVPSTVRGAGFRPEAILQWSLHPAETLGLLLSDPFGDRTLYGIEGFWAQALVPGRGHELWNGLYVGGLALALALLGAFSTERRRIRLAAWFAFLALLALGQWGPLYPVIMHIPVLDAFRYPVKWLGPAMFPLALLAGAGVQELSTALSSGAQAPRRRSLVAALTILGILATISIAATVGFDRTVASWAREGAAGRPEAPLPPERRAHLAETARSRLVESSTRSALPLLAAVVIAFVATKRGKPLLIAPAAAALLSIDILATNPHLAPTVGLDFYDRAPAVVATLRAEPEPRGRVWVDESNPADLKFSRSMRGVDEFFRWERELLRHETGASYGFDLAFSPDIEAFSATDYARLKQLVVDAPLREKLMVLGAAGATHLVTLQPFEDPRLVEVGRVPARSQRPLRVYRNRLAVPRVRMVGNILAYDGTPGFIDAVRRGGDDLFARNVLVDRSDLSGLATEPPSTAIGSVSIDRDVPGRLGVRTSGAGGWLVVSDTLVPGCRAELDGQPVRIVRADFAFRAVRVPPGEHTVRFSYSPW